MTIHEFEKLKIEDLRGVTKGLSKGEFFITPELEAQRYSKKPGDTVSVYYVNNITEQGYIVYEPRYIILD